MLSCVPYRKTISINILDRETYDKQSYFYLELLEPHWKRPWTGVRVPQSRPFVKQKAPVSQTVFWPFLILL